MGGKSLNLIDLFKQTIFSENFKEDKIKILMLITIPLKSLSNV